MHCIITTLEPLAKVRVDNLQLAHFIFRGRIHIQKRIAIIGGGICGLTTALRLAENGLTVELFEAALSPGGRTRSFLDRQTGEWCDNGPHLLNGAYRATQRLLADCDAADHICWQPSLKLPLWDRQRGHFSLRPSSRLPFPVALLAAVHAMPGHNWKSALAMMRVRLGVTQSRYTDGSVESLMQRCHAPDAFIRDMIEPICLGAMNEPIATADATTFGRVLTESFASKSSARLGWFNAPLQQALIEPVVQKAERSGATIHCRHAVRTLVKERQGVSVDGAYFDAAVIALPAYARNRLLASRQTCATGVISNIHLWYRDHPGLPDPFIGGIDTLGQWYFDISAQTAQSHKTARHLCVVISADPLNMNRDSVVKQVGLELSRIAGCDADQPAHIRLVREKRATVLVRQHPEHSATPAIIEASESPQPGELPATIEFAVQRGEKAALDIIRQFH